MSEITYSEYEQALVRAFGPFFGRSAAMSSDDVATVDAQVADFIAERDREQLLARKIELVDAYGVDSYPDDTVLMFTKNFGTRDGSKTYTYVALRVGGRWYLTGRNASRNASMGMTWGELVTWLVSGCDPVDPDRLKLLTVSVETKK